MKLRGNWGAAEGVAPNSHGNFRRLLKAIRVMESIRMGLPISPSALTTVRRANPEYFDGDALSTKGLEILEKVIDLIPAAVSKDGVEYLKRRNANTRQRHQPPQNY